MTWPTKKLGEIADYINGRAFKPAEWGKSGLPIIRIQNLTETQEKFNYFNEKLEDKYLVKNGDILLSWSASLGVYVWNKGDAALNQHIFKVVPHKDINKNYLFYALIVAVEELKKRVHGSTMTHVTKPVFSRVTTCIPPLKIQKQIVERLDKIAEAQKLNDELIQKSDELFQSLLHKELVSDSKKWEVKKLGDICDVRDGTHESPKFYPSGVPLITSKNLIGEGVDFENINYISLEDHKKIDKRSKVDDGDILFGMIGTIGNPVIVKKDREFSIKNVGLIKPTALSPINYFIYYSLLGNFIQKQVKKFSRGGTQKFVSLGNLRNLKIIVPNKIIQKQIVEKLSAAQEYKKQLLAQKSKLKEIFDSVLDKSMKGEIDN